MLVKMKEKTPETTMNIKDRIRELRRVPASSLRPNPKNWRTHPSVLAVSSRQGGYVLRFTDDQRDTLRDAIAKYLQSINEDSLTDSQCIELICREYLSK
jgi:hypothetical protein